MATVHPKSPRFNLFPSSWLILCIRFCTRHLFFVLSYYAERNYTWWRHHRAIVLQHSIHLAGLLLILGMLVLVFRLVREPKMNLVTPQRIMSIKALKRVLPCFFHQSCSNIMIIWGVILGWCDVFVAFKVQLRSSHSVREPKTCVQRRKWEFKGSESVLWLHGVWIRCLGENQLLWIEGAANAVKTS